MACGQRDDYGHRHSGTQHGRIRGGWVHPRQHRVHSIHGPRRISRALHRMHARTVGYARPGALHSERGPVAIPADHLDAGRHGGSTRAHLRVWLGRLGHGRRHADFPRRHLGRAAHERPDVVDQHRPDLAHPCAGARRGPRRLGHASRDLLLVDRRRRVATHDRPFVVRVGRGADVLQHRVDQLPNGDRVVLGDAAGLHQ